MKNKQKWRDTVNSFSGNPKRSIFYHEKKMYLWFHRSSCMINRNTFWYHYLDIVRVQLQSFCNIYESVTVQTSASCWLIVLDNDVSRGEKDAAKKDTR